MGRTVIVVYKALANKEKDLLAALKKHLSILQEEGLASDRPPVFMKSSHHEYIEVFEWKSPGAIEQAHKNSKVQTLWQEFSECCTYETLSSLSESSELFAEFETIDL